MNDVVSLQPRPIELWNHAPILHSVLDELLVRRRFCLADTSGLSRGPGYYVVFYRAQRSRHGHDSHWLYGPNLASARYPLYAGSTVDLRERISTHARKAALISSLGHGADLYASAVATTTHPAASYAEELLLELLKPVWNSVVRGWGSRSLGSGRLLQRTSEFSNLHPRDDQRGTVDPNELERLVARARLHVAQTQFPKLWPSLK